MLAPYQVEEIRQLLASGTLSERTIARRMGVSRGTVRSIAAGRRRDPVRSIQPWDEEPDQPLEPPRRCPTCGGLVYMPCRLCRMRKLIEKQKQEKNTHPRHSESPRQSAIYCPSGLALKPDHPQRYEEVRHWREALEIIE
jgi:hypothetical protein